MNRRTVLLVVGLLAALLLEFFIQMRSTPVKAGDDRLYCGNTKIARLVDGKWACWNP